MQLPNVIRRPSAFVPVAMSAAAVAVVAAHVAMFGMTREADEGPAAHIWQLLIVGQVPAIGFYAIKWLRKSPREAFFVLGFQTLALLVAMTPVYLLKL